MSDQSPYGYQQASNSQEPKKGFNIFGLTWEKNLVSHPVPAAPKNVVLAYVLWFFLGVFGVHQYYIGNMKRGLFILAAWAIAAITSAIFIGGIIGLALFVYWIYEAVTLNDQVQEANSGQIRQSIL